MIDTENKIITYENLSNNLSVVLDDYTIDYCTIVQHYASTSILSTITGLVFTNNNIENCILPVGSTIGDGNFIYQSTININPTLNGDPGEGGGVNGAVFITDVEPTGFGSVGNKTYNDDDNIELSGFDTDTDLLTFTVLAFTGNTTYEPVVTVNNITITNFAAQSNGQWVGTVSIDLGGGTLITAVHEDGPEYECTANIVAGPVITDLRFVGGYPGSLTELPSGQAIQVAITTDIACNYIEVSNYEACTSATYSVSANTLHTISVTIANRGSGTYSQQAIKARTRSIVDIFGTYSISTDFGSGDGVFTVELNNDTPVIGSISQVDIAYPTSQEALKDSELATVSNSVTFPSGTGTVVYSSPNGDLSISNDTTYETSKVVNRISGSYNISTTNFRIVATKTTNGKTATGNAVVYVANTFPTITRSVPYARFQSSPAGTNYNISLISTQNLIEAPSLDTLSVGVWQGVGFSGGPTTWIRALQVIDSDEKGTYSFSGLVATNLSGKVVNTISGSYDYTLGGFVSRNINISAWPNREGSIGTRVSDTSKLICYNQAKGADYPIYYTPTIGNDTDSYIDKFTITDPSGVFSASGNLWYNCDVADALNNVGGGQTITISESV